MCVCVGVPLGNKCDESAKAASQNDDHMKQQLVVVVSPSSY